MGSRLVNHARSCATALLTVARPSGPSTSSVASVTVTPDELLALRPPAHVTVRTDRVGARAAGHVAHEQGPRRLAVALVDDRVGRDRRRTVVRGHDGNGPGRGDRRGRRHRARRRSSRRRRRAWSCASRPRSPGREPRRSGPAPRSRSTIAAIEWVRYPLAGPPWYARPPVTVSPRGSVGLDPERVGREVQRAREAGVEVEVGDVVDAGAGAARAPRPPRPPSPASARDRGARPRAPGRGPRTSPGDRRADRAGSPSASARSCVETTSAAAMSTSMTATMYFVYG